MRLSDEDMVRTLGVSITNFGKVLAKYSAYKWARIQEHLTQFNPNLTVPKLKPHWTDELEIIILLLHYHRKYTPWDLHIFFRNPFLNQDVINRIIHNTELDIDAALLDEMSYHTEPERLALARRYNMEEHHKVTMTSDGGLVEIKKPLDKVVQEQNWCYKGYPARSVQFSCLVNGKLTLPPPSHPGSITDITQFKFNQVFAALNPATESMSLDKGFDGAQEITPCCIPVKKRDGKRTAEEKAESNKLKRQRIIIENCINCVKRFKILKGRFPYPIEGAYFALKFDRVIRICTALTNIHMSDHPIRTPKDITRDRMSFEVLCVVLHVLYIICIC
jgi:hypothetical protein